MQSSCLGHLGLVEGRFGLLGGRSLLNFCRHWSDAKKWRSDQKFLLCHALDTSADVIDLWDAHRLLGRFLHGSPIKLTVADGHQCGWQQLT